MTSQTPKLAITGRRNSRRKRSNVLKIQAPFTPPAIRVWRGAGTGGNLLTLVENSGRSYDGG